MRQVVPLLVALAICAVTAIVGGVFFSGLWRNVLVAIGVVIAVTVYSVLTKARTGSPE